MKKQFSALAAAALLALAGCQGAKTPSSVPAPPESEAVSQQDEGAPVELFDEIYALETGTAGSSLKAAAVAARLLDWREDALLPDEGFCTALTEYANVLPADEKALFAYNLTTALSTAETILTDEASASLLEDAGHPQTHDSYDAAKQQAFLKAVAAAQDWETLGAAASER